MSVNLIPKEQCDSFHPDKLLPANKHEIFYFICSLIDFINKRYKKYKYYLTLIFFRKDANTSNIKQICSKSFCLPKAKDLPR